MFQVPNKQTRLSPCSIPEAAGVAQNLTLATAPRNFPYGRKVRLLGIAYTPYSATHSHPAPPPLFFPALAQTLPEVCNTLDIIHVQEIHSIIPQRPPNRIPRTDRPPRLVPVAHLDSLAVRNLHLALQQRELRVAEASVAGHARELDGKVRARNRRDVGRDVAKRRVQRRDGRVVKVVARLDALHLVQRRVARPDHGDGAGGDGGAVERGQVARVAQGLERLDHVGEGRGAVCLDVDEEVQCLARGGVEDAVLGCARGQEGAVGILLVEDREDGLDVQRVKGSRVGQGGLLVSHVQRAVVQPDVGLDGDAAGREGGVKGHRAPVVVVTMERFGYDALCEAGGIRVLGVCCSVGEDLLQG